MVSSLVTFCGIRRGVGNATVARAFAVSSAESNECVLIEADRPDDTSFDWAERRRKTLRYSHIAVHSVGIRDCVCGDALDGLGDIVVLQVAQLDDGTALTLAKKSRLFVLTATPSAEDVGAVERLLQRMLDGGIASDSLVVVLCSPLPDYSKSDFLTELQRMSRAGIKAFDIPFLGNHAAGPLKNRGLTIAESISAAQTGERVIDFLQKAFVDRS